MSEIYVIENSDTVLAFYFDGTDFPEVIHFGAPEPDGNYQRLSPPKRPASSDRAIRPHIFPMRGQGYMGENALKGFYPTTRQPLIFGDFALSIHTRDTAQFEARTSQGIKLSLVYHLNNHGLLEANARIDNKSDNPFELQHLASLSYAILKRPKKIISPYGSWAKEGFEQEILLKSGAWQKKAYGGRTGFSGGPFVTIETDIKGKPRFQTASLVWGGNFQIGVEVAYSGQTYLHLGEFLEAGEIALAPGDNYQTPTALLSPPKQARNAISKKLHQFAREKLEEQPDHRPAQLNSWEALYFDIDEVKIIELIDEAAMLGLERVVIDDGWFGTRTDDTSSLGDWQVNTSKFPNGIKPLTEYAKSKGIELGIWFEPEMISSKSRLYGQHPDWCISIDAQGKGGRPTGRNQLVLDLTKEEVSSYIVQTLTDFLSKTGISYVKWDHNRDLYPSANAKGPIAHKQQIAISGIFEHIKTAFPKLSLEICASGAGRLDYGWLNHGNRYWTSDATDAEERYRIQKSAARYFPLSVLGAHVGPSPNPITKNEWPMALRCAVAMFGHFGVEADIRKLTKKEKSILKSAIQFYKKHRGLIHDGDYLQDFGTGLDAVFDNKSGCTLIRHVNFSNVDIAAHQSSLSTLNTMIEAEASYVVTQFAFEGSEPLSNGIYQGNDLLNKGLPLNSCPPKSARFTLWEKLNE